MADHERIWLEPECCAEPGVGRVWCQVNEWMCFCPAGECDKPQPTEYVRADLVAALVEAAGVEMREQAATHIESVREWGGQDYYCDSCKGSAIYPDREDEACRIRALPLPTPALDAIRAQARREGMEVAAKIAETDRWARTPTQIATAIRAAMGGGE